MKKSPIKFEGHLYIPLEEGCYTMSGKILDVIRAEREPERLEAERKVIEAARRWHGIVFGEKHIKYHLKDVSEAAKGVTDALSSLDSLGGGK